MIEIRDLYFENKRFVDLEDLKRYPYGYAGFSSFLAFSKLLIDGVDINQQNVINESEYSHVITVEFYEEGFGEKKYACSFNIIGLSNDSVILLDNHDICNLDQGFFALYFPTTICVIRFEDERLYSTLFKNSGIILGVDGDTALFYKDGKRGICDKNSLSIDYRYDEVFNIFEDYTCANHVTPYYKRFKSIRRFNNNTYVVKKGGAFGIINEKGFEIVPCRFEGIKNDCVVVCGKIARYYPEKGTISELFDDIQQLGKIRIGKRNGKITYWDYLDRYHDDACEQIKGFSYSLHDFLEPKRRGCKDYFVITNGNMTTLINYYGHVILEIEGYQIVDVGYDAGCYSVWGSLSVEELKLSDVELFNDSLLFREERIMSTKLMELRDRFYQKGMNDEWNYYFHKLLYEDLDKYEIAICVKKDGMIGVMDKSGNIIVPSVHSDIKSAYASYFKSKNNTI